jgi:FKBP-type peptidyl-prolyl cis-trans isomerase (trigger factor)
VKVLEVKTKTIPTWDEALAARVRDGMTLAELDAEVTEYLFRMCIFFFF